MVLRATVTQMAMMWTFPRRISITLMSVVIILRLGGLENTNPRTIQQFNILAKNQRVTKQTRADSRHILDEVFNGLSQSLYYPSNPIALASLLMNPNGALHL